MKRDRRKNLSPSHRITITFLFLSAIAILLCLTLFVWPGTRQNDISRTVGRDSQLESERHLTGLISKEPASESTNSSLPLHPGKIAVVIDDAGNDLHGLQWFLEFPGKLTIAVLPQLPFSTRAARRIHEAGKEVMLHLPLEPLGSENPGPGVLEISFSPEQIYNILDQNFDSVPFAHGVNNHMGSLATQDPALMNILFTYLKEHEKYFVDSRTTASSLGRQYAEYFGLPFAERTYFIDNKSDKASIMRALNEGIAVARVKGKALLIGHVQHAAVMQVLTEVYDELVASGIEFITVTEFIFDNGGSP